MGAKIIEKHFVTNTKFKCIDLPVSITEKQMKELTKKIDHLKKLLAKPIFGNRKEEKTHKLLKEKKSKVKAKKIWNKALKIIPVEMVLSLKDLKDFCLVNGPYYSLQWNKN